MYYRVVHTDGDALASGHNCETKEDVKSDLLDLLEPQICDEDWNDYQKAPLADILAMNGWHLEESETPFYNPDLDYDENE
jgi:hypothetical protein